MLLVLITGLFENNEQPVQVRAAMPNADSSRWVTPETIADVFVFLASDAARDITGAAIPVYGRS